MGAEEESLEAIATVGVTQSVCLLKRCINGKLIPVDEKYTWVLELYSLDKRPNKKAVFPCRPRQKVAAKSFFKSIEEDAWAAATGRSNNNQTNQHDDESSGDHADAPSPTPQTPMRQSKLGRSPQTEPKTLESAPPLAASTSSKKASTAVKRARRSDGNQVTQRRRSMRRRVQA